MNSRSKSTLASTIIAAQQYDQAAFERLFGEYTPALYRYLYARCADTATAEDLLSTLWLQIFEVLPKFRIPDENVDLAFTAWLYRIARNLVYNHYRRLKREALPLLDGHLADEPALVEQVQREEDRAALHEALVQLTPEQREVLLLRFFEGHSSIEVASQTGRSLGAVKSLQHRALAALARILGMYTTVET